LYIAHLYNKQASITFNLLCRVEVILIKLTSQYKMSITFQRLNITLVQIPTSLVMLVNYSKGWARHLNMGPLYTYMIPQYSQQNILGRQKGGKLS